MFSDTNQTSKNLEVHILLKANQLLKYIPEAVTTQNDDIGLFDRHFDKYILRIIS